MNADMGQRLTLVGSAYQGQTANLHGCNEQMRQLRQWKRDMNDEFNDVRERDDIAETVEPPNKN